MVPRHRQHLLEARRHGTYPIQPHQRLSQLYSDTKRSYTAVSAPPAGDDTHADELVELQRNYQIQKDRLIAWGLGWSDDASAAQVTIDESVERAGLTEVVTTVMESIQNLLTQVDRIHPQPRAATLPAEKSSPAPAELNLGYWSEADRRNLSNLTTELTSAIDILYELTSWRRTSFEDAAAAPQSQQQKSTSDVQWSSDSKAPVREMGQTPVSRKSLPIRTTSGYEDDSHATALLHAAQIDISSLVLPEEPPPPYHSSVQPAISPRVIGYFQRTNPYAVPGSDQKDSTINVPVLVEYANYDSSFKTNGASPPLGRLTEILQAFRSPGHLASTDSLLALAGYFEDPHHSRMGLVYELPASAYLNAVELNKTASLLTILQASVKVPSMSIPPLEQRFRLAYELVNAFTTLQENDVSHRDVSSSNIIFFSQPPPATAAPAPRGGAGPMFDLRKPYICSFDLFSEHNVEPLPDHTILPADILPNLYRHPNDPRFRGAAPDAQAAYRYDCYALGLVLLEIGLWSPISEFFKQKYSLRDFRTRIQKVYVRRLADRCGTAYMKAVVSLLGVANASFTGSPVTVCASTVPQLRRLCLAHDEILPAEHQQFNPTASQPSGAESSWNPGAGFEFANPLTGLPPDFDEDEPSTNFADEKDSKFSTLEPAVSKQLVHSLPKPKRSRGKVFEFPNKELPKAVTAQWDEIGQRLSNIVAHALRHSRESSSVSLTVCGESEETAKPTLLVTCASTHHVRCALKRKFAYDKDAFNLIIAKGSILRSKASRRRPRRSGVNSSTDYVEPMNPFHQERPLCGASIGAFKDNEHLPPVSYGGVVMVDGAPYGMSVHHLMEEPEDDDDDDADVDEPQRSSAATTQMRFAGVAEHMPLNEHTLRLAGSGFGDAYPTQLELEDDYFDSDDDLEDMISDVSSDDGDFDDTDTLDGLSSSPWGDSDDTSGDREGIAVGEGEEIVITQPALDDVSEDFFPSEEDRDDDHLDSHTLGHIHASSGIRRCTRAGISHEIDWSLIKLRDSRLQPHNLVPGGRRYCQSAAPSPGMPHIAEVAQGAIPAPTSHSLVEPVCRGVYTPGEDLYPQNIIPSAELGNLHVHCFGRTSGLQGGRISSVMDFVKFPGRRTFSKSWFVVGNFGIGGDSGAWVIDNADGAICGHVLAWSAQLQRAYIAPMEVLFEDMKQTLGVQSIGLPVSGFDLAAYGTGTTTAKADTAGSVQAVPRRARADLIADVEALHLASTRSALTASPPPLDGGARTSHPAFPSGSGCCIDPSISSSAASSQTSALSTPATSMSSIRSSGSARSASSSSTAKASAAVPATTKQSLLAHHLLLTGAPDHMEREWSARRTGLGAQISS